MTLIKYFTVSAIIVVAILIASVWSASCLNSLFPAGGTADWVQAVGAVIAIVTGFGIAAYQTRSQRVASSEERSAAVRAAHALSFHAIAAVTERLDNAVTLGKAERRRRLQGNRTTEMVYALREFDTTRLPAEVISDLIRFRSNIFAINERITEVYLSEEVKEEKDRRSVDERPTRFLSAAHIWEEAIVIFNDFQQKAIPHGATSRTITAGTALRDYIKEIKGGRVASTTKKS